MHRRRSGRTGPRTKAGKARAAQNAFRHGLARPICEDPTYAPEVEELARLVACGNPELIEEARRVAEAHLDLRRIRKLRDEALQRALSADIYLRPWHRIWAYLLAMKSEEVGLTD
jgi:hypothetical protein